MRQVQSEPPLTIILLLGSNSTACTLVRSQCPRRVNSFSPVSSLSSRIPPSLVPTARMLPERSMLRQLAPPLSHWQELSSRPALMSQLFTAPLESQLARRPSFRLKRVAVRAAGWPQKVWTQRAIRGSQRERVLSALAVARRLVQGWKWTLVTESTCPRKTCLHLPMLMSSSLQEASREPVATQSPVRLRSMLQTGWRWSRKVKVQLEWTKSHTFTVLSPEPVRMWWPLGWNLMQLTQSLCPSPDMISSDWFTVQIFHRVSSLPVPTIGFLGWKTTAHTDME